MIKVIAFDMVGVLVGEKYIELTNEESKLERMFGPNINDEDYLLKGLEVINNKNELINVTLDVVNKLYYIKDKDIFKKIKYNFKDIKIIIATNHVSYIRSFIENNMDSDLIDDIVISAEINKIKPNNDFYLYILDKYNIEANELLFLDDNIDNINGASSLGINTIKVNKNEDVFNLIFEWFKK